MKRKRIFLVIASVLVLSLIGWRMWPHTFRTITSSDEEVFHTISIQVCEIGISDCTPTIDFYQLKIETPKDEHYTAIVSMLEDTDYRSDFRNLLPWEISSVGSESDTTTYSAIVTMTWGNDNRLSHGGGQERAECSPYLGKSNSCYP